MKTRRPIGCRNDPDGPDPVTTVQTFLFRENAAEAAAKLQKWETHVQYVGAWDRWVVECKRKSWGYGNPALLRKDGTITKEVQ